ncbi:Uncharacterised protein [Mycobacterium tuberculosis]|nr:Uncharacterised protein [Mycobacterium tuberculosis]SGR92184.1 Uncharacterised protein [Mycobacterium tuberculosis]
MPGRFSRGRFQQLGQTAVGCVIDGEREHGTEDRKARQHRHDAGGGRHQGGSLPTD